VEQCDDGGNINGDGCSSSCVFEIPTATLVATPASGLTPLTTTFTATKNSWANHLSMEYGDAAS